MRLYGLQKLISDLPPIPSYSLFDIDNLQQRGNVNQPNYTISASLRKDLTLMITSL